jgi:hypothetical protein
MGDRVAILDTPPNLNPTEADDWKMKTANLFSEEGYGALYYPWIKVDDPATRSTTYVPPSGHIAGVWSRSDDRRGVHKAPANEEVLGVVVVSGDAPDVVGVNPLLVFPGRGIRVWGARTLAEIESSADPDGWVNMRRLVLTLERWLVRALEWAVFETNDFRLWVRIHRELEARLTDLFLRGAFQGKTAEEAFRIKCDEENNPAAARASGRLQVDIQIAPAVPQQFVQIRLIRSAEGLTVE